jgi:hypothetical protein
MGGGGGAFAAAVIPNILTDLPRRAIFPFCLASNIEKPTHTPYSPKVLFIDFRCGWWQGNLYYVKWKK